MKIYNIFNFLFVFYKIPVYLNITHLVAKSEVSTEIVYCNANAGQGLFSQFAMSPWFDCGDYYVNTYEVQWKFLNFVKIKKIDKIKEFIKNENVKII